MADQILFVEDELELLEDADRFLTRRGLRVQTAGTAAAAMDIARVESIDVAIVDRGLPDMDGLDLISKLRDAQPSIQFVVLSGHASPEDRDDALARGVTKYLTKPQSLHDLHATITSLGKSATKRKPFRANAEVS